MKKTLLIHICIGLLLIMPAYAQEEICLPEDLAAEAGEAAQLVNPREPALGLGQGLGEIWQRTRGQLLQQLTEGLRGIVGILAGVVLLGVVESMAAAPSGVLSLVGALWITAATAGNIRLLLGLGRQTVLDLSGFSKVLLPSLAMATSAAGGVTGAPVRQLATVFFSDILLTLMERVLLPGVYLLIGVVAADAALGGGRLEAISRLLRRGLGWGLCGLVGLFTGYLTLTSAITGGVDRRAVRLAQAAVSAAVPVVGRILSQASESVLAGAGLLRGMIGVCGTLGVVSLCLGPVLRLGIQYGLYQAASLLSGVVGPSSMTRLLKGLGGALGLVLALTAASAAILLISIVSSLTAVLP